MKIKLESLSCEFAVHTSSGQVDKVIATQCSANVAIWLLNQKSVLKVTLDPDETEIYKQLATKIEDRIRHHVYKRVVSDN